MLVLGGGNKLNQEYKDRVHKIEMQKEADIRRKRIQEEKKKVFVSERLCILYLRGV